MRARDLKQKFVEFFEEKNHVEIPSSSLIPENDPTTLFISAGMHPLVPFLLGQTHPQGKRLVDVQKCVRTGDIDDVGDTFHHTFFEMLGNWSLGDYFKKEMIPWSFEFLTKHLDIDPKSLHVTVFEGDKNAPRDEESANLWREQGIKPDHIHFLPKEDNWWGPAGTTGPCGPDSEMFFDTQFGQPDIDFKQGCKQGRYIEIWNDVFMQFNKTAQGTYLPLPKPNVDTGMGIERTTAVLSGFSDNYLTEIWQPIIKAIEKLTSKTYLSDPVPFRIIADHLRSAVFIMADGVEPSNKEAGYVLRRLLRRSIRQGKLIGIETNFIAQLGQVVIDNQDNYGGTYPELNQNKDKIISFLEIEENKFRKTLNNGLREIQKLIHRYKNSADKLNQTITGKEAFTLFESFGFPLEMIDEELKKNDLLLDRDEFEKAKTAHTEQSRTLSAGKFKSGLADHSEIITKYHTATHLLHTALRQILGQHVQQSGSNITSERLRFDFSHPDKLTPAQLKKIEDLINQVIDQNLPVSRQTLPFSEAQAQGALAFFGTKYPEIVSVYTVGSSDHLFSKEVCTGPHVENTGILGKFEIQKEESAGSGKRRIYAILK